MIKKENELINLLQQTRNLLSFHRELGIENYPRLPALENFLQSHKPNSLEPARRRPVQKDIAHSDSSAVAVPRIREPKISVTALRQEIAACRQCPLGAGRKIQILGEGTTKSGLLIIADIPAVPEQGTEVGGLHTEQTGEQSDSPTPSRCQMPDKLFSGQADELLTRMLAAIDLPRESVYITPLLKCLPARTPAPDELRKCLPVLHREIAAAAPRLICTMGPLAARTLLGAGEPLFKLRGRFHHFLDLPLMPTFHPAYLLRNPEMKKASWQDLQAIQKSLEKNLS